jgi:hypothetical protein
MSVQKALVFVQPLRRSPRAAAWLVNAVSWLFSGDERVRDSVPAWIEAVRARMAVDLAARRDARARAELMSLARRYASSQPEFAKDLFAAAGCDRND